MIVSAEMEIVLSLVEWEDAESTPFAHLETTPLNALVLLTTKEMPILNAATNQFNPNMNVSRMKIVAATDRAGIIDVSTDALNQMHVEEVLSVTSNATKLSADVLKITMEIRKFCAHLLRHERLDAKQWLIVAQQSRVLTIDVDRHVRVEN